VAFIHRFGASLNLHTHFHGCVIDGVFEPDPQDEVRFFAVEELDAQDAEAVQAQVRRRILRAFVRRGILDKEDRRDREQWEHGGGFSLDATARIEAHDRRGLERLLRYCARPPFAAERIEELDRHRLIYHLPKPGPDGRTQLHLSPLELIERIAALVPPPRQHRHRYYGVLAANAPLRAALTALAPEAGVAQPMESSGEESTETPLRAPARYLRAMLLARIYEAFPLRCPTCGTEMHILAFIAPRHPPCSGFSIAYRRACYATADRPRARTSAGQEEDDAGAVFLHEERVTGDPLVQPEPAITVGRPVTRPPPYRSPRAELPHGAPQSYSLRT